MGRISVTQKKIRRNYLNTASYIDLMLSVRVMVGKKNLGPKNGDFLFVIDCYLFCAKAS